MIVDSPVLMLFTESAAAPTPFLNFATPAAVVVPAAHLLAHSLALLEVAFEGRVPCVEGLGLDHSNHLWLLWIDHHRLHYLGLWLDWHSCGLSRILMVILLLLHHYILLRQVVGLWAGGSHQDGLGVADFYVCLLLNLLVCHFNV